MEGIRARLANASTHRNGEFTVSNEEVLKVLRKTKPNKSVGPDGVRPNVPRTCAEQLNSILCYSFNVTLIHGTVPMIWKMYCIVPVPKKRPVKVMNDLRLVALSSSIKKGFEMAVLVHLKNRLVALMDSFQILHVLNNVYSHLEKTTGTCFRLMFYELSSAFNTTQLLSGTLSMHPL